MRRKSMLLGGLSLLLKRPGAVLWTYAFNVVIAMLFAARFYAQAASLLDHSLANERLNGAFDLGTVLAVTDRMDYATPSSGQSGSLGLPVYLLVSFVLVPGALACYHLGTRARLRTIVAMGLEFFWRFVRIALFTALGSGAVLVPLILAQSAWMDHVSDAAVGRQAFLEDLPGLILIVLIAALLRLYFDLVEVYTVQLADRQDRRVRAVLLPALRTLGRNLPRAYGSFLFLLALTVACAWAGGMMAAHRLAQPRVWPIVLLTQAGLLGMLACRFWQRAAATVLAADNPLPPPAVLRYMATPEPVPEDAQPNPEPEVPSLPEPDPGVFHHEPGQPL